MGTPPPRAASVPVDLGNLENDWPTTEGASPEGAYGGSLLRREGQIQNRDGRIRSVPHSKPPHDCEIVAVSGEETPDWRRKDNRRPKKPRRSDTVSPYESDEYEEVSFLDHSLKEVSVLSNMLHLDVADCAFFDIVVLSLEPPLTN